MNSQIAKSVRAIRKRRSLMAVVTKHGRLRVHEMGSSMYERSLDDGWEWVGTYTRDATPEMIAEDLGVAA